MVSNRERSFRRAAGKRFEEEKMIRPLVVENFMRVIGAHIPGLKVNIILTTGNELVTEAPG
jgi:hypothetical protein